MSCDLAFCRRVRRKTFGSDRVSYTIPAQDDETGAFVHVTKEVRDSLTLIAVELHRSPWSASLRSSLRGTPMLDFSDAIEDSFASMSNAPKFVPGLMAPRDDPAAEIQFMQDLEARFQKYRRDIAHWQNVGRTHRAELEKRLDEEEVTLEASHLVRIQLLVDDMAERIEQDTDANTKSLRHMKKMGRRLMAVLPRTGEFVVHLVDRIRTVAKDEMRELTLAIDWWRGIVSHHDPDNRRSQAFTNPADVLTYLKSA